MSATTRRTRRRTRKKFGLPVRDAERPLTMPLLQVDIDKAGEIKPEDVNAESNFLTCVIAQAVTRAWGAERVAILRRSAYVAFPGENHTKRYEIEPESQKILAAWDRGEHIVEGVELRLKPPTPGRRLDAMRRSRDRWKKRNPEHQTARKTTRKQAPADPLHSVVRNGNLVRWSA